MNRSLQIILAASAAASTAWSQALSVSDGLTPPGMKVGLVNGSYSLGDFESMNLFTGKANFAMPLLQVGGRGQAGYQMMLHVESTNWQVSQLDFAGTYKYAEATWDEAPAAGLGPGYLHRRSTAIVTQPSGCTPTVQQGVANTYTTFVLSQPGGGSLEFFPVSQPDVKSWNPCQTTATDFTRGSSFATRDGSAATLLLDTAVVESNGNQTDGYKSGGEATGYILFKNGTRYNVSGGEVTSIVDRNGNLVAFEYYPPENTTPKSVVLNQGAIAQGFDVNLPSTVGSANLAALAALRVELRIHGFTLPATGSSSVLWSSRGGAGPMLRLRNGNLEAVLTESGASGGCFITLGSRTDIVVRFERQADKQYQLQAWDYVTNGTAAPFASGACPVGTASSIDVSGMMAIGADYSRSAGSLYKGRLAYVRVYDSNTSSNLQPTETSHDAMLNYALNSSYTNFTLDHNSSKNLSAYGGTLSGEATPGERGPGTGLLKRITDSLGRVIDISLETENPVGNFVRTITYKGFQGTDRTIKIHSKEMQSALRGGFSISTIGAMFNTVYTNKDEEFNPRKIWRLELPDGRPYDFQYNSCGEVAAVILPTLGSFTYDWNGVAGEATGICKGRSPSVGAIERFVSARKSFTKTGAAEASTEFERTSLACGTACPGANVSNLVVGVLQKDGSGNVLRSERHVYFDHPNSFRGVLTFPGWKEGKEFRTDTVKTKPTDWATLTDPTDNYLSVVKTWKQYGASGSIEPATYLTAEDRPRVTVEATTMKDSGTAVSKTNLFEYDEFNNLTSAQETDWGGTVLRKKVLSYKKDGYENAPFHQRDLPVSESIQDGGGTERSKTEYKYDEYATAGLSLLTRPATVVGRDGAFSRNERGNLTRILAWRSDTATTLETKQRFDVLGNVVEHWNPRGSDATQAGGGYKTSYEYTDAFSTTTALASGTAFGFVKSVTLPLPLTTSTGTFTLSGVYDRYLGRLTEATDFNGNLSTYSYSDPLDRPTSFAKSTEQVSFGYPAGFSSVTTSTQQNSCGNSAQSLTAKEIFDSFGRPERTQRTESGAQTIDTKTVYDGLGRVLHRYLPFRNVTGVAVATDGEGKTVTSYDWLGRPLTVTNADGSSVQRFGYLANETWSLDEAGKWKRTKSDGLGRLKEVSEDALVASGSTIIAGYSNPSGKNYLTSYSYDERDNLVAVNQGGRTRSFEYNSLGWLTSATNPESGTITYGYDNNGNLTSREDGRATGGVKTKVALDYDRWNRVQSKTYTHKGEAVETPPVTYTYDAHPTTVAGSYPKGRLTKVTVAGTGATVVSYDQIDALGRVLKSTQNTGNVPYGFEYTYQAAGQVESVKYPGSGRQVYTCYDAAGRVASVRNGGTAATDIYAEISAGSDPLTSGQTIEGYDAKGGTQRLLLDSGKLVQRMSYNVRGQMAANDLFKTAGNAPLMRLGLTYGSGSDNNGNIRTQSIQVGGTVAAPQFSALQTFTYDGLNRLESAVEGTAWKQTLAYDQWGNRWFDKTNEANNSGFVIATGTPDAATSFNAKNQVAGAGLYDAAGNGSPIMGRTYTYDVENRIVGATGGTAATTESFEYDGDGRRVKRTVNGLTTVYVYDAFGQLAQEYGGAASAGTGGRRYVYADHLGSTRMVVDGSGSTVDGWWDYAPFGEEIPAGAGGRNGSGLSAFAYGGAEPSAMFTGQVRDRLADGSVSGLDYFGARYMSAAQGRWTSPDRINVTNQRLLMPSSTLNKYVYAANNPLKYVDPNGEDITVFVKKNMTHPQGHWVGHAMLGVHNQATGEVRFLDYFPRDGSRPVGRGVNAGADLTLDRLRQHASLTIQTSPEVAQKAIELIDKLTKDPGTYWLVGNNCTDTCENILRELGLYGGDVFTPDDFWDRVSDKHGNKPNFVPGTGARIYPYAPGKEFGNPSIQGIDYVRLLFYMLESQRNATSKPAPKKKDYEVDVTIRYDIP